MTGRVAVALLLALGLALAACAPAAAPAHPTVSVRMHGTPAEATVVIDDEVVGSLELVAARGVAVPPGVHHVTVKADGYFPWDHEVEARLGQGPVKLEVALVAVPD